MANPLLNNLRHWFRRVTPAAAAEETDRQLLERFARQRDALSQDAFAAVLARHGPMVLGVCRRVLGNEQDAEDAFQATFLVLARRADAVRWQDDIANWLYTVACRVARKLRAGSARRRESTVPAPEVSAGAAPALDLDQRELRAVLDEEVSRLPEKYRAPLVLCYLEGKSYGEAARLLGWAEGTVSGRLARARDVLRRRLVRRGLAPAGAVLAAVLAPGAVSPALAASTARAALVFRAGPAGAISPRAAGLAEGVLRSMTFTQTKTVAALLLAVCLVGTGVGVLARQRPQETTPLERPARVVKRPPLPEAWKGRWQTDPFAGTTSIEVKHTGFGLSKTYHIKDPAVVAALLAEVKITSVQNDFARGNIPSAFLTFHRKGADDVRVSLASDSTLQFYMGEVHVRRGFVAALNKQVSKLAGDPVDLLKYPPGSELPRPNQARPRPVPPSVRGIEGGWKGLTVMYTVGGRLHEAKITDAKVLKALLKSLQVVGHQADQGRKGLPYPTVGFICADGSHARAHVLSDTQLYVWDVGLLTIKQPFVEALGRELSHLEGRPLVLRGKNALTEKQTARAKQFRQLLSGVRTLRYHDGARPLDVSVDKPEHVKGILKGLSWVEVPLRPLNRPKEDRSVELTTAEGKKVRLTYFKEPDDKARGDAAWPLTGELVEVAGLGQVWIDGQWKYRFVDHATTLQFEERAARALETTRLVAADLSAFLRQVLNVEIVTGGTTRELLTAEASRPVLEALQVERVEKLNWTEAKWKQKFANLEKADELILTPGLGFSLSLIVSGDREMLIPGYGRVTFKTSPKEAMRKAASGGGKDSSLIRPGGQPGTKGK